MRIMYVVSCPAAGGAEVYVKDLAKQLGKYGNEVTVAFLGAAKDVGRSENYERKFLDELEAAGVHWEFIGNKCRKKPWCGVSRIRNIAKTYGVEVYHSHLPFGVIFGLGLNCPIVYTHHTIKPRLNPLVYWIFNQLIDRYVGISEVCAEKLSGYTGRNVTSILNGVDVRKISGSYRTRSSNSRFINAIAVGRIHPHKGYYFLAKAIRLLPPKARSRIRVSIAGEGDAEYTAKLKRFINELEVAENFQFLGNRTDVPELLAGSDLFLMCSEQEGLPISLIEATVSGLPCIVTDVGGCAEIIEMCRNGVAVDRFDVGAYACEIRDFIETPKKLGYWSANAVDNCVELDIANAARKHLCLYKEVLGRYR